jgi:hypothetical protein
MRVEIGAPATATVGSTQYEFSSWSDGGARVHQVATPAANTTYTATFTAVEPPPPPPPPSSSPRQQYLSFDAAGDRVAIPNSANAAEGTAITVSAWVRFAVNDASMHIVTKSRSGFNQWMLRRVGSNNKVVFNVTNAGGTMVGATSVGAVGTDFAWHHVAGVYDGASVYLYIDGDRTQSTSAALTGAIRNDVHSICIGALDPGSGDCGDYGTLRGDIDDVRIYDRALTQNEIQQTMDVELAGTEAGLAAYWKFNEGQNQSAFDASPSLLHGVLGTTPSVEPADPTWMNGGSSRLLGWPASKLIEFLFQRWRPTLPS